MTLRHFRIGVLGASVCLALLTGLAILKLAPSVWALVGPIFVPLLLTIGLPDRWLMIWLPLLGVGTGYLFHALEGADGPGGFVAYAFVAFFVLLNGPVALAQPCRISFKVVPAIEGGY